MFEKEAEEILNNHCDCELLSECMTKEGMTKEGMTKEELERLYMDIYDNGIPDNDYKEKFKRYVNNRLESLEKENAELKERNKELLESCEGATMMYKDLCKAKEIIKGLLADMVTIDGEQVRELTAVKEAGYFLNEVKG